MILSYLNIALGAAIVVLNLIEIIIITRRRKRIKPYEQLLSSLAVADSLTGACLFFIKVYGLVHTNGKAQEKASGILYCIVLTTVIISTVSLASITADRLLAIKYPFYHRVTVTKSRVWLCAIMEWLITWVLVTIPTLIGTLSSTLPQTMLHVYQKITSWFLIISGVLFCVCYADLLRCLAKRPDFQQMQKMQSDQSVSHQGMSKTEDVKAWEENSGAKQDTGKGEEEKNTEDASGVCCEIGRKTDEEDDTGDTESVDTIDYRKYSNQAKVTENSSSEKAMEEVDCCTEGSLHDGGNHMRYCGEIVRKSKTNRRTRGFPMSKIMKRIRIRKNSGTRGISEMSLSQVSTSLAITVTTDISSETGSQSAMNATAVSATRVPRQKKHKSWSKRERHLNRTVALACIFIVFIYLVCTTPYTIQIMLDGDPLAGYTGLMLFLNSLCNPLIYFYKGYLESKIRSRDKRAKMRNQRLAIRAGRPAMKYIKP